MAAGHTNLSTVLLALQAWLVTKLGFPAERVLIEARDSLDFNPQADQYAWIRPRSQRWAAQRTGGGRFDNRVRRRTTVTLRTRLLLDESTQDAQLLTNASLGHLPTEHALFNALEMWQPFDTDGSPLLYEPLAVEEARGVDKVPEQPGWGQDSYAFDLPFVLDLDQTVQ